MASGSYIALSVPVPLFNDGRTEVARFRAEAERTQARRQMLEQRIFAELSGAHSALQLHRAAADEYRRGLDTQGQRLEQIAQAAYQEGELDILGFARCLARVTAIKTEAARSQRRLQAGGDRTGTGRWRARVEQRSPAVRKTIFILGSILLAGCTRQQPATTAKAPAAPETVAVSHWTDKTELFMEHQPLVAGVKRRFAVHFTSLRTFQPLAKGSVSVRLAREGGEPEVFATSAPSRPGIFGLDVQPRQAGRYQMTVSLTSPGLDDAHELGAVVVYASEKEIPPESGETRGRANRVPERAAVVARLRHGAGGRARDAGEPPSFGGGAPKKRRRCTGHGAHIRKNRHLEPDPGDRGFRVTRRRGGFTGAVHSSAGRPAIAGICHLRSRHRARSGAPRPGAHRTAAEARAPFRPSAWTKRARRKRRPRPVWPPPRSDSHSTNRRGRRMPTGRNFSCAPPYPGLWLK